MKNKFEIFEMNALIYFIMRAGFIGIAANAVIDIAHVDSYLSPIIGTLIGIIFVNLYIKIAEINPDKNINENLIDLFGEKIGKIIIIFITIFVFSLNIILYYDIVNFITSEYLYFTPKSAIAIVLAIPFIYLLSHDIKVICRAAVILFFISLALYILSISGLVNQINFDNLLPFLENGINPVIKGTLIYTAYITLPIFLLTIIPKNSIKNANQYKRKINRYYLLLSLILIISETVLISVLGIDLAQLYQYPDYHLLRRINLGGFIQRIESLLAVQWIICIFVMVVFCGYYIVNSLSFVLKIKNNKALNIIIPILVMYLSMTIFKNNTIATKVEIIYYPYFLYFFLLLIPLIIYITNLFKKKKNT